ncbi:MAG: hypothetical protein OEY49_20200 [Candidatus Heimdallarchaeota archaeon]|nr:hypothetical protein [Candidatus Heimdallarchaeota archaeon]
MDKEISYKSPNTIDSNIFKFDISLTISDLLRINCNLRKYLNVISNKSMSVDELSIKKAEIVFLIENIDHLIDNLCMMSYTDNISFKLLYDLGVKNKINFDHINYLNQDLDETYDINVDEFDKYISTYFTT